jgi:bacillithiol biosynthesis deacetylase BshB1
MKLDILAFAAHPDDVELSASGTLLKYIAEGKKVGIIDLTRGELGSRGTATTRSLEAENAGKLMGLSVRDNLDLADGFFDDSFDTKMRIIQQIRKYQPDIVLANAMSDRHPDHGRAGKIVADASFLSGLLKIQSAEDDIPQAPFRPQLLLHYIQYHYLKPDIVIDVSDFMEQKIEVIKAFTTQFYDPNFDGPETPISGEDFFDFIKGRMMTLGRPIGAKYAEGFTCDRILGVDDLFDLR